MAIFMFYLSPKKFYPSSKESMSFQCYFMFVQQLGQYNFGISVILMQFDHYFMCLLIVESLVCLKHFDLIKSQVMMDSFLQKLKSCF